METICNRSFLGPRSKDGGCAFAAGADGVVVVVDVDNDDENGESLHNGWPFNGCEWSGIFGLAFGFFRLTLRDRLLGSNPGKI